MRIDPETCRDPDLLASEVRRLQAVIDAEPLRLTDAEREAVEYVVGQRRERESWVHATLRGLLSRTGDCPTPDNAADRDNGTADSE